jgi:hypothetical protein
MTRKASPLSYSPRREVWTHQATGRQSKGFHSKLECAKDYARELVKKEPRYKPLLEGKDWPDVFRILGIDYHV